MVTAKILGMGGVGVEANPLMAFVSRVKGTWEIELPTLKREVNCFLAALAALPGNPPCSQEDIAAIGMPEEILRRWLEPSVLGESIRTQKLLENIPNRTVRDFLALGFSKSLYEASNVKFCPGITFLKRRKAESLRAVLSQRLKRMVDDLELLQGFVSTNGHRFGSVRVIRGDCREADALLEHNSVDFLVTSPPYPGDVEYTRLFRLELYFLGFIKSMKDVQAIKRTMVRGTPKSIFKEDSNEKYVADVRLIRDVSAQVAEKVKDKNWGWDYPRMVREYFGDMYVCLRAVRSVLKPGAYALFVVGDQTVKGVLIPTGEILRQIGEKLEYTEQRVELYRHRRSSTHSLPLAENIVILRK